MILRRRFAWLCVAATVVLLDVTEDVLGNDSSVVDRQVLVGIHETLSLQWTSVFGAATLTASAHVLLPVVALVAIALSLRRFVYEAALLVGSAIAASLVVYVAKLGFGRARPQLWDTQWYWGSSFPSGHTLSAAAVATAACLIVARMRPQWRAWCVPLAFAWVVTVAMSRLVLGVHWPTDVIAAACAGVLVAAAVNAGLAALLRERPA